MLCTCPSSSLKGPWRKKWKKRNLATTTAGAPYQTTMPDAAMPQRDRFGLIVLKNSGDRNSRRKSGTLFSQLAAQ